MHFFVMTRTRTFADSLPSLIMWTSFTALILACAGCQPTMQAEVDLPPTMAVEPPSTIVEPPEIAAEPSTMAQSPDMGPIAEPWPSLLANYATADGGFRYAALVADDGAQQLLAAAVEHVAAADLTTMDRDTKLAFLINAYNVLVIRSVVDAWPVDSVLNVPGFFDVRTHRVAGMELTLNGLENDHIRTMGDPRIHFAVNCASTSCPPLAVVPYSAATLDVELEQASVRYVRATTRVMDAGQTLEMSRIFEWFVDDFASVGGIGSFVRERLSDAQRAELTPDDAEITFAEYDWALNGR